MSTNSRISDIDLCKIPPTRKSPAVWRDFNDTGASCANRKPRKLCDCRKQAAQPPDRLHYQATQTNPQSYRFARNVPMILSSGITCMKVPTTSFASGP